MEAANSYALFLLDLDDLYDAERQFLFGVQQMEADARDEELGALLREHVQQTERHVKNLERIFRLLQEARPQVHNEAASALVNEAKMAMQRAGTAELRDRTIDNAAAKVEHYEIASYRALIADAALREQKNVELLLKENLHDEEQTAQKLEAMAPLLAHRAMNEDARANDTRR
jgi:ferritin-like metal-binding protein YciE